MREWCLIFFEGLEAGPYFAKATKGSLLRHG